MKHIKKTNCCFGMTDAELVEKNIKFKIKINVVGKIQFSRNLVNLDGVLNIFQAWIR